MTGLSQVGGMNLGAAGFLPRDAQDGARLFNLMFGQASQGGGNNFLQDVKDAKTSTEKRALIEGYASGYAAAGGGEADEKGASRSAERREARAERREERQEAREARREERAEARREERAEARRAGGPEAAGAVKGGDANKGADLAGVMEGFSTLADLIDHSQLPEPLQNKMLDGIAGLMSQLQGLAGKDSPSQSEGPMNGEPILSDSPASEPSKPSSASESAPAWSHEAGDDGKAELRLGDKYTVSLNEEDASWTVRNNETGKETKVSGDPHVDKDNDGKNDFDFKKDMTFQLDDGTKITVGTVDAGNGTTYSSKLTITNGENAFEVEGLGTDKDGKDNLKVTQSTSGTTLDDLAADGAQTIYEDGGAWTTKAGEAVTQAIIDQAEQAAA